MWVRVSALISSRVQTVFECVKAQIGGNECKTSIPIGVDIREQTMGGHVNDMINENTNISKVACKAFARQGSSKYGSSV
jgi:hypothetical protein